MNSISQPKSSTGRGIKLVLAASLTLNLVIAGLVAGAYFGRSRDFAPNTAMSDVGMGPFISALPSDVRRKMGAELVERAGSLRENRRVLQEQFDTMLALLRADKLDLEQVRAISEAQSAKLGERQQMGRELLFAQIGAMSADERRAYADRLEERLKRGKKDWPRERPEAPHPPQ